MKVIVCADSHGAFAAAERLLEQNREESNNAEKQCAKQYNS